MPLYSRERDLVAIVQEAGWALELFQRGLKNCVPHWVLIPDLLVYRKLLSSRAMLATLTGW